MARTDKQEYSNPDGWHVSNRLARQARPAGRNARAFAADLDLDGPDDFEFFPPEPVEVEAPWYDADAAYEAMLARLAS